MSVQGEGGSAGAVYDRHQGYSTFRSVNHQGGQLTTRDIPLLGQLTTRDILPLGQ